MIRKATIKDIKAIHALLQHYGREGKLLPRPLSVLYDHMRDFSVFVDDKNADVLGCCALQICWDDLAEIRSLAVHPEHLGERIGSNLVAHKLSEAKSFEILKVFALTYRPSFFKRFGFKQIDKSDLPIKIWADCIMCIKFPDCDEIAMMKELV